MINEVADVAVDTSIDGEKCLGVVVVEIKQVRHAVGIIHLTASFRLLIRYHLQ